MKKADNLKKNKKSSCLKFMSVLVVFVLLSSFVFIFFNTARVIAGTSPYTPASPTGNISTDINIENEYIVFTSEIGSSWMFDWGDGRRSDWIQVGESDESISQSHSWSSYGEYEVKVKHRNIYMTESAWSPSLDVKVTPPTDLDGDGFSNDMEIAYGTDPNDPDDYPIDTENEGTPEGEGNHNNDGVFGQPFGIPWLYIILGIIVLVIVIILILFKKGILYLYQEEYIIEE